VPPYKGSVPEYPAWANYNIVFHLFQCNYKLSCSV
jgi:hypothetical protein